MSHSGNAQKTGFSKSTIEQGFWPPLPRRPLCPRFHPRPTDTTTANPYYARIRSQARLEHRRADERGRLRRGPRELRATLIAAARRREIDVVLVWRLDRWGRSVSDLVSTLQELQHLGVGFVSLTEALDLTTPAGRAMAGLLAVFAEFERDILRERVRAGLVHARQQGKKLGRPPSVVHNAAVVWKLCRQGISKSEIARRLQIGRTSVRRLLAEKKS
jgi:putative DNA-invertase from lambdoid prophage Rac